jgi:hypothetical protein
VRPARKQSGKQAHVLSARYRPERCDQARFSELAKRFCSSASPLFGAAGCFVEFEKSRIFSQKALAFVVGF